jgi:hypothetical protein
LQNAGNVTALRVDHVVILRGRRSDTNLFGRPAAAWATRCSSGRSLQSAGIAGALQNPTLELRNANDAKG